MIATNALIQKARARWEHYVLLARWKRADRVRRLLARLDRPEMRPLRLSA